MYAKFFKRVLDFLLSLCALILLSPLLIILTIVGAIAMRGNPFFVQKRPGMIDKKTGQERMIHLIKFRTMTNAKDANGNLLPDEKRLNKYGRFLRSTSLDELPEIALITCGSLALIGPRPQLFRDLTFMTPEQRRRQTVRQGLTGLAQVSGRNSITWEEKFNLDLQYIDAITFLGDAKILLMTVAKVLKREGISAEGMDTADDFGDALLKAGKVTPEEYDEKQIEAKRLLKEAGI